MKEYNFFDTEEKISILFDENKTISDLINAVFEKYDFYEPNGIECVTVYDMQGYHVVTNRMHTLAEEHLSSELCFAYYLPGEFLYVEGGWGHHMIQMDACRSIKEPLMFEIEINKNTTKRNMVCSSEFTVQQLYNGLVAYFDDKRTRIEVYETYYVPSFTKGWQLFPYGGDKLVKSETINDVLNVSIKNLIMGVKRPLIRFGG